MILLYTVEWEASCDCPGCPSCEPPFAPSDGGPRCERSEVFSGLDTSDVVGWFVEEEVVRPGWRLDEDPERWSAVCPQCAAGLPRPTWPGEGG